MNKFTSRFLAVAALAACSIAMIPPAAQAQERRNGTAAVTQATSATTGVTLDKPAGVITTVAETAAANASVLFTVTNAECTAKSPVLLTIDNYSGTFGTNGTPIVSAQSVGNGSFVVRITNAHPSNALAGTLKIGYLIAN